MSGASPTSPVERVALSGRRLGDFIVHEKIGEGGFGVVFRAEQAHLQREAAIKVLHARLGTSDAGAQRFLREAQLASRLDHPYAAHIYSFGVEPDGLLWIAMELVRGTPLDQLLRVKGPLALEQFVPLLERVCEVVHTAHEQGIVHRDIKPANVMVLSRAGRLLPKLLDFGIAKWEVAAERPAPSQDTPPQLADRPFDAETLRGGAAGTATSTGQRGPLGSPAYMAPEQWLDTPDVGPRSDLYALGVLTYEALVGRPPFTGGSIMALARAHAQQAPPSLGGDLPGELDVVLRRALAKQPADRYGDALAFATAVRQAAGLRADRLDLPRLDEAVRDATIAHAPQPIAEAVTALDAARNPHQALDALWQVYSVAVRWVSLIAMAARAHVSLLDTTLDPAVGDTLRILRRRPLSDEEWLDLARGLSTPFLGRVELHPIPQVPELVAGDAFAELGRLRPERGAVTEAAARDRLAQLLPRLSSLLGRLAFLADYTLVVPRGGVGVTWMGVRRARRTSLSLPPRLVGTGQPVLLDADGAPVLALAPLVQVAAPAPGAPEELFLFDGQARDGPRLVALPTGLERRDDGIWKWLAAHLLVESEAVAAQVADERAPYLGLAAFGVEDAGLYFGREREVEAVRNRLAVTPFVAIVGPSGVGKSSFVHAGVVPACGEDVRALTLRPGAAPIHALVARLRREGATLPDRPTPPELAEALEGLAGARRLVLVVDQLEELFTLCAAGGERERFVELLAGAAPSSEGRVRVVVTLRDDFLLRAQALPALRDRLAPALTLLTVPSADDLRRVVEEPARRVGFSFEDPQLPAAMVAEVADRPGALALLSFTAARLWDLRDRAFRHLTRRAYQSLGGVGGALAQHAEGVLSGLGAEEQRLVREAFRHLVTNDGTRAVLTRAELRQVLGGGAHADNVVEKLVTSRLLVSREAPGQADQIEIIHETLLEAWPRLVEWRRQDAEGSRLRDQLRAAARQWAERGRPRGLLWRDEALAELNLWLARHRPALTDLEAAFVAGSRGEAAGQRRVRVALLASAFVVLGGGAIALGAAWRAEHRAERVARERLAEGYEEQARQALAAGEADRALGLLHDAVAAGRDTAAIRFMLARGQAHLSRRELEIAFAEPERVAIAEAAGRAISWPEHGPPRLWDLSSGRLLRAFDQLGGDVARVELTPDGARAAFVDLEGGVQVLRTDEGGVVGRAEGARRARLRDDGGALLIVDEAGVVSLLDLERATTRRLVVGADNAWLSPDGRAVGVLARDGRVGVIAATGGEPRWLGGRLDEDVTRQLVEAPLLRFSPDGGHLCAYGAANRALLWRLDAGNAAPIELRHDGAVLDARFSPDGKRVATASIDRTAREWDVDGTPIVRHEGHANAVNDVRYAPDGRLLLTASDDGTARLWEAGGPRMHAALLGHDGAVYALGFHAGRAYTVGRDASLRGWSTRGEPLRAVLRGPGPALWQARQIAPDTVIASGEPGAVYRFALSTGKYERVVPDGGEGRLARVSDDGKLAVVADLEAGVLEVIELGRGRRQATLRDAGAERIDDFRFSPDARHVVACGVDGVVRVWEVASGQLRRLGGHRGLVSSCVFAPDGSRLASAGADRTIRIWELSARADAPRTLTGHGAAVAALQFSRSGAWLLSAGFDRTARLWRLDRQAAPETVAVATSDLVALALSPDEQLVAIGAYDGSVRVSTLRGRVLWSQQAHAGFVSSLSFADPATLLSTGQDGAVALWDVRGK